MSDTTHIVTVQSFQEIQDRMDLLGKNAEDFIQRSMFMALNGQVMTEIKQRTPRSSTDRYAYTYDKSGKKTGRRVKAPNDKTSGQSGTLYNSLGGAPHLKGTTEITLGATAPYAGYVHDAKKPIEGDYWEPGKTHGWTKKGSGNKFISGPLEKHADDIPKWAAEQLDKLMQGAGIF